MTQVESDVPGNSAQVLGEGQNRKSRVFRQTAILTALSIVSPTLGLISEAALAWRFGASGAVDAYRVTVLLLLYGQQLFVTAILPFVLVPIFAECRARGNGDEAWAVADSVARVLLIFGIVTSAFLFFRSDLSIDLIAPGLMGQSRATAIYFMHWCGLGFLPICWTGAACGILYAHDVIQVGALSQLTANLIMALAILFGGGRLGPDCLILGVLGGALASTCICTYKLRQVRRKFGPSGRVDVRLKSLSRAFSLAAPLVVAMLVAQGTSIVINRTLSFLAVGSLASFGYAIKLGSLVQLAPNAMTTVLFPKLSSDWFSQSKEAFGPVCAKAVRAALFISLPLACVCYTAQTEIVAVLLGRGAFQRTDVHTAGMLFGLMIIGAPASTVMVSLSRAFYAAQQPRYPVVVDVCGNSFELAFIPALAARFGLGGVGFAYMLLPWITGSGLLFLFIRRNRSFPATSVLAFVAKVAFTAILSAWLAGQAAHFLFRGIADEFPRSLITISFTATLALLGFFAGTLAFGIEEARSFKEVLLTFTERLRCSMLPVTAER